MTEQTKIALASIGFAAAAWAVMAFTGLTGQALGEEAPAPEIVNGVCSFVSTTDQRNSFIYKIETDIKNQKNMIDVTDAFYGDDPMDAISRVADPDKKSDIMLAASQETLDEALLKVVNSCPAPKGK